MAGQDCQALRDELAAVEAKISAIIGGIPSIPFDWTVGHVRIDNTSMSKSLEMLREHRDDLWSTIQKRCPCEMIEDVITGLDEFGNERGC